MVDKLGELEGGGVFGIQEVLFRSWKLMRKGGNVFQGFIFFPLGRGRGNQILARSLHSHTCTNEQHVPSE